MPSPYVVLILPGIGKWVWSRELQIIDFIPANSRTPLVTEVLTTKQNTSEGALSKALRASIKLDKAG